MPYKSISQLPSSVRKALPKAAQKIFMDAFNKGYHKFKGNEERAFKYAWGAVKKTYIKKGDKWVRKNSIDFDDPEYEWLAEWVYENSELLTLQTGDIVSILPKRFWEVRVNYGYYQAPLQGKRLWEGLSKGILTHEDHTMHIGSAMHLIEDNVCYGIFRFSGVEKWDREDFDANRDKHGVSKEDDEKWFARPGVVSFYSVDWLRRFPGPLPIKMRKKRRDKCMVPRKDYSFKRLSALSSIDLLMLHSYCHSGHTVNIKEFHELIKDELEIRGIIHPYYSWLDRDFPDVMSNWESYDATILKTTQLMDDHQWACKQLPEWMERYPDRAYNVGKMSEVSRSRQLNILEHLCKKINTELSARDMITDALTFIDGDLHIGTDTISMGNVELSLEELMASIPEQFSIDEPPARIWLSGDFINGVTDTDINVVIQSTPDIRIANKFLSDIDEDIAKRIKVTFSAVKPDNGIPLYRSSYQRMSSTKNVRPGSKLRHMTSRESEFTNLHKMWHDWAGLRADDMLVVEKKYKGIPVSVHHQNGKTSITKYKSADLTETLPTIVEELSEVDNSFVALGHLVYYNCNGISTSNKEVCVPIDPNELIGKTLPDTDAVVHVYELLYVDGQSLHSQPYIDRIERLTELLPEDSIHITQATYALVNTKSGLERAVERLSELPGSVGAVVKEANAVYAFSGKSSQIAELSHNADTKITLPDCDFLHEESMCPLYHKTHQALSDSQIEVQFPVRCQIASLRKCPLVKEEYYEESDTVKLFNWSLDS